MRLLGLIIAGIWIAAVAWFGWTSLPQLPLDVSATDPGTIDALNAARTQHALTFGAIALFPAVLVVWLGRWLSR
jgi:hypothetical protein